MDESSMESNESTSNGINVTDGIIMKLKWMDVNWNHRMKLIEIIINGVVESLLWNRMESLSGDGMSHRR